MIYTKYIYKEVKNKMNVNKKFMKDIRYQHILVTYQGERDGEDTSVFYINNSRTVRESTSIITVEWDKQLEEYRVTDSLKGFDAKCRANVLQFLGELNQSVIDEASKSIKKE